MAALLIWASWILRVKSLTELSTKQWLWDEQVTCLMLESNGKIANLTMPFLKESFFIELNYKWKVIPKLHSK